MLDMENLEACSLAGTSRALTRSGHSERAVLSNQVPPDSWQDTSGFRPAPPRPAGSQTFHAHTSFPGHRQAGPFHLWDQPLHSKFTLSWSRPGLKARQLVRNILLGTVWVTVLVLACCHCWPGPLTQKEVCSSRAWERQMTVLMTLLGGEELSLHIGWLFKKREGSWNSAASCQHFTFCLSPREASTEPLGSSDGLACRA